MIGDVHGAYKALREVLRKMSFSDSDELYFTGDAADGYPDVYRCLCLFREIRHFHPVIGNHDAWLQNWLAIGSDPSIWLRQGGAVTVESFRLAHCRQPERLDMAEFLASWPYAIDTGKEYICHGGPGDFLSDEGMEMLAAEKREMVEYIPACYGAYMETDGARATWDRSYFQHAYHAEKHGDGTVRYGKLSGRKRLFVGHTELSSYRPFISRLYNMVDIDTAAGSYGYLTIMDMDTLEWWQSTRTAYLYPDYAPPVRNLRC